MYARYKDGLPERKILVSRLHDTGVLCASHVSIDGTVLDLTTDLERSIHPEGLKDSRSDIWAIGVIALELIYGGLAVSDRATFDEIVGQIVKTKKLPACFGSGMRRKEKVLG